MAKLFNLARMITATTGTGTVTLGSAVSGFLTFVQAGVVNGDIVSYGIKDGVNSEVGTGTYTAAGTTLTRTVIKSTNADAAISLSGAAEVFITALKEDFAAVSHAFTPAGNIAATNVQTAIQELDTEKVAKAGDTMAGNLRVQGTATTPVGSGVGVELFGTTDALIQGYNRTSSTYAPVQFVGTQYTFNATGIVSVASLTASTSSTTGALTVAGGVGIGGTTNMAGDLILDTVAHPTIWLRSATTPEYRQIVGQTGTSNRWILVLGNADAETGSDAGSNLTLTRCSDAGGQYPACLSINRATGNASFSGAVAAGVPSTGLVTGDLSIARSASTGYIHFGSVYGRYLGNDGTNFIMAGGPLVNASKSNSFGNASGNYSTNPVTAADANILLYGGASNWAGIGTDPGGSMWFRTGLSGTPVPAMYISSSDQRVNLSVLTPNAASNVASKAYVDTRGGVVKVKVFTASGTYTPDANLVSAMIEVVGGGAGGGGITGASGYQNSGGGGGSGGYSRRLLTKAQIGASQSISIGAAGSGSAGAVGGAGGQTTFGASLCYAYGGSGGPNYAHSGFGGAAGFGDFACGGAPGVAGFSNPSATTNLINCWPGAGGSGPFGGGGNGGQANGSQMTAGQDASGYGSGGGGGTTNHYAAAINGGNGMAGVVIVTEFCTQ